MIEYKINRVEFKESLQKKIFSKSVTHKDCALLLIDIDNLKEVNYLYGYDIGDLVIQNIINRVQNIINEHTIYLIDGNEFAVILNQDSKSLNDTINIILESIRNPLQFDGLTVRSSVSIGISIYSKSIISADELIKHADIALLKAKQDGGNNYKFFEEIQIKKIKKIKKIKEDLLKAIDNEELIIYFQPKYDVRNNIIVGMEALVRWAHPIDGFIYPDVFIPIAEKSDLIVKIDEYVMRKAMQQFTKWQSNGLNPGRLSLNLSIRQLSKKSYISKLNSILQNENFNPKFLTLEVLEREVMQNPKELIVKLYKIKNMGINISIDDFGTGYSSLSYLSKLPLSTLKIDRSFINDIPFNKDNMSIIKAIIALAESLNLSIVAEGVENIEQIKFLIENNCDIIQGYYFCKPQPPEEIESLLIDFSKNQYPPIDIKIESKASFEYAKQVEHDSESIINHEIPIKQDDGSTLWLKEKRVPLYDENNKLISSVIVRYDVTNEKKLENLATTDALTLLNNRVSFNVLIEKKIKESKKEKKKLALIIMDIDNFRRYNDSYGQDSGDLVLKKIADLIQSNLKKNSDFAFRLGGEEFGVLYEPLNLEDALEYAENIVLQIKKLNIENIISNVGNILTVSLGLLLIDFNNEVIDSQGFISMATDALSQAKANGKDRVVLYENEDLDFF